MSLCWGTVAEDVIPYAHYRCPRRLKVVWQPNLRPEILVTQFGT